MKYWPVPESYSEQMPQPGEKGSFWENRSEFFSCGVEIYAPENSAVLAIESGMVIDKGVFTSSEKKIYWNTTYYITIKTSENINYKYCELSEVYPHIGDFIDAGQEIGRVGKSINKERITSKTPYYIRELVQNGNPHKLHLELYKSPINEVRPYSGGNFSGNDRPQSLLDPLVILSEISKKNN